MKKFDLSAMQAECVVSARDNPLISLSNTALVDSDLDLILAKINGFSHLTEIDVSRNRLTDVGINKIINYCLSHPNIDTQVLDYNGLMTEKTAIELLQVKSITQLSLWKNIGIKDSFVTAVLEQKHLTKLDVRDTGIDRELILKAHAHVRACAKESSPANPGDSDTNDSKCNLM